MGKQVLTDKGIKALKPAPKGQRKDYMDAIVPGFGIRVTDKADDKGKAAQKTFVLVARYPGGNGNPTRRALGEYGALALDKARGKARDWIELIRKGVDPATEIERARQAAEGAKAAEQKAASMTIRAAMEDYIVRHVSKTRKAADVEREIRKEIIPSWGDRLVSEITEDDVTALVRAIADRGAIYQAHNIFGHVRTFYSWLIATGGGSATGSRFRPVTGCVRAASSAKRLPGNACSMPAAMKSVLTGARPLG